MIEGLPNLWGNGSSEALSFSLINWFAEVIMFTFLALQLSAFSNNLKNSAMHWNCLKCKDGDKRILYMNSFIHHRTGVPNLWFL